MDEDHIVECSVCDALTQGNHAYIGTDTSRHILPCSFSTNKPLLLGKIHLLYPLRISNGVKVQLNKDSKEVLSDVFKSLAKSTYLKFPKPIWIRHNSIYQLKIRFNEDPNNRYFHYKHFSRKK